MTTAARRGLRSPPRVTATLLALALLMPRAALAAPDVAGARSGATSLAPPKPAATTEATERAHAHFARGVERYDEQDYRNALIEFERAYAEAPARSVLLNIGQARYQLLDHAGALQALEDYVASTPAGVPDPRRALVEREIAELAARVGRVSLRGDVEGAEVLVDDVAVKAARLRAVLRVSAGRRRITVRRGAASAVRVVDVAAGDTAVVTVAFTPPAPPRGDEPLASRADAVPRPAPHAHAPAIAYAGFAVGAAGALAGATFGVLALRRKSSLDRDCVAGACAPGREADIDALRRDATASTIAFGAGAAGVLVGIASLLVGTSASDAHVQASTGSRVQAYVGAAAIGVAGRF
jgi:hypothetical protein